MPFNTSLPLHPSWGTRCGERCLSLNRGIRCLAREGRKVGSPPNVEGMWPGMTQKGKAHFSKRCKKINKHIDTIKILLKNDRKKYKCKQSPLDVNPLSGMTTCNEANFSRRIWLNSCNCRIVNTDQGILGDYSHIWSMMLHVIPGCFVYIPAARYLGGWTGKILLVCPVVCQITNRLGSGQKSHP